MIGKEASEKQQPRELIKEPRQLESLLGHVIIAGCLVLHRNLAAQ